MAKDSRALVLGLLSEIDDAKYRTNWLTVYGCAVLISELTVPEIISYAARSTAIRNATLAAEKEANRLETKTAVLDAFMELQGKKKA